MANAWALETVQASAQEKVQVSEQTSASLTVQESGWKLGRKLVQEIDLQHFPVGHATCFDRPATQRVDVTQAVQEARQQGRQQLSLVLIREQYWPDEQTDDVSAVFASREAGLDQSPVLHVWR